MQEHLQGGRFSFVSFSSSSFSPLARFPYLCRFLNAIHFIPQYKSSYP